MVYATGHLSGAHINPAVTLAFVLNRHFPRAEVAAYVAAMAVATDTRAVGDAAAIAIGGTVGLGALAGGPVTGASTNPARSLGPALASGSWTDLWVYLAGPVLGAAAGANAYQAVRGRPPLHSEPNTQRDGARPVRLPA